MKQNDSWREEFHRILEDLLQDIILLEALSLYTERTGILADVISPELLEQTRQRLLDYLSQHIGEVSFLSHRYTRIWT